MTFACFFPQILGYLPYCHQSPTTNNLFIQRRSGGFGGRMADKIAKKIIIGIGLSTSHYLTTKFGEGSHDPLFAL